MQSIRLSLWLNVIQINHALHCIALRPERRRVNAKVIAFRSQSESKKESKKALHRIYMHSFLHQCTLKSRFNGV